MKIFRLPRRSLRARGVLTLLGALACTATALAAAPAAVRWICTTPTQHFSATVRPGAQRIAATNGPFTQVVAFQNPDRSRVLLIGNDTKNDIATVIDAAGTRMRLTVPAQSMNTLILR